MWPSLSERKENLPSMSSLNLEGETGGSGGAMGEAMDGGWKDMKMMG